MSNVFIRFAQQMWSKYRQDIIILLVITIIIKYNYIFLWLLGPNVTMYAYNAVTGFPPISTFSDIIFNILEYYYNIIHNQEGTATYVDFYKWYLFVSDLVFILAGY
jgi:hypothetical protein